MSVEERINVRPSKPEWTAPVLGLASILGVASASCCVLPIGLSILGLGGTWLTVLEPFVAYRTVILIGVGAVLAAAWADLIMRRDRCARRKRTALILAVVCSVLLLAAATAPVWERDAARTMWSYWTERT